MNRLDIKEFRKKYNLTQEGLANIVGTTIRAVQGWEQGQRKISQSAIKLIENYENNVLNPDITDIAFYDIQLSEEKLKKANKRIELLEELVESYKLEINDLKNELSKFTKGKTIRK